MPLQAGWTQSLSGCRRIREWLCTLLGKEVYYDRSLLTVPEHETDPADGVTDEENHPRSPGMKYKHYSPAAKVYLIEGSDDKFRRIVTSLGLDAKSKGLKPGMIDYGEDARKAAHKLFADLRELDRQGYDVVFIRTIEQAGLGFSVMNRMLRSAGFDVIK